MKCWFSLIMKITKVFSSCCITPCTKINHINIIHLIFKEEALVHKSLQIASLVQFFSLKHLAGSIWLKEGHYIHLFPNLIFNVSIFNAEICNWNFCLVFVWQTNSKKKGRKSGFWLTILGHYRFKLWNLIYRLINSSFPFLRFV